MQNVNNCCGIKATVSLSIINLMAGKVSLE